MNKKSEYDERIERYKYVSTNFNKLKITNYIIGTGLTAIAYRAFVNNVKCVALRKKLGTFREDELEIYKITRDFVINGTNENFIISYGISNNHLILESAHSNMDRLPSTIKQIDHVYIYIKIFKALKLLHDNNILHNDVTFSNVLFLENSVNPLLMDYDRSLVVRGRKLKDSEIEYDVKRVVSHTISAILNYNKIKHKPPFEIYTILQDVTTTKQAIKNLKKIRSKI
jgi:tRNA A-37 threonylcarbamoyl transferase component Bud32